MSESYRSFPWSAVESAHPSGIFFTRPQSWTLAAEPLPANLPPSCLVYRLGSSLVRSEAPPHREQIEAGFLRRSTDKPSYTVRSGRKNQRGVPAVTTTMDTFAQSLADGSSPGAKALAQMPLADIIARWRRLTGEPPAIILNSRSKMLALLVESVPAAPLTLTEVWPASQSAGHAKSAAMPVRAARHPPTSWHFDRARGGVLCKVVVRFARRLEMTG